MAPDRTSSVHVYFDESGTHGNSSMVLAGAVEVVNTALVEREFQRLTRRTLASAHLWQGNEQRRGEFAARGFHYTEDNASVQGELVSAFGDIPFRASVMYSRRLTSLTVDEILINMFLSLVRNLLGKYKGQKLVLVFEENSSLNDAYANIVEEAISTMTDERTECEVWIGEKPSSGLSLVDYVLGIAGVKLAQFHDLGAEPQAYKIAQYDSIQHRIAHIFDFDDGIHRSRFRDIVLQRAQPTPPT